jgi:hypothetical protein
MTLQCLIITFKPEEIVLHAHYRSQDGPNPGSKARTRAVAELARSGLRDALEALEDGAECVGTSGFTQRQDVLVALPRSDEPSEARRAAS